jgi:hypothetical protein
LGEVKIVSGHAVAGYFCENGRAAHARGIEVFQNKNCRAFTENHAGAMSIKRTAFFWRRGLKRIKADENQFRECVVTTRQHALVSARAYTLERVTNRIGSRRARICNHLAWCRNSKGFLSINHRLLRGVVCDPCRRMSQVAMSM